MEMDGKVVVITGASMGIGEAIAKVFADRGASVVLLSRDAARAEEARQRVGHTDRTLALACDVRKREEIDRALAATLERFGRVDVWANNAGVGIRESVTELEMSACRELFETNFFGAIGCLQAVVPAMRKNAGGQNAAGQNGTGQTAMRKTGGGTIINVSSVAGHVPLPFGAAYSATKFALNAIGTGARMELKRDNINVLTVCPGYVRTDFGVHMVADRKSNFRPKSVQGITAERVARATYDGYRKKKREVIVPWTMIPVIKLYQLLPGLVEWGIAKMMMK
ncbi:MAG: SDR family NAD(P)-dependent oxidoreductase [Terriglobales bacterium]|jgi:short-subunit dehydrogenase